MGPEELEGALGTQRLPRRFPQHRRPAQIEGAAGDRFGIGATALVLQERQQRQQRGRGAGASEPVGVEGGEVLVSKQPVGRPRELAMKAGRIQGNGKEIADIKQSALSLPLSQHGVLPSVFYQGIGSSSRGQSPSQFFTRSAPTFRPHF